MMYVQAGATMALAGPSFAFKNLGRTLPTLVATLVSPTGYLSSLVVLAFVLICVAGWRKWAPLAVVAGLIMTYCLFGQSYGFAEGTEDARFHFGRYMMIPAALLGWSAAHGRGPKPNAVHTALTCCLAAAVIVLGRRERLSLAGEESDLRLGPATSACHAAAGGIVMSPFPAVIEAALPACNAVGVPYEDHVRRVLADRGPAVALFSREDLLRLEHRWPKAMADVGNSCPEISQVDRSLRDDQSAVRRCHHER